MTYKTKNTAIVFAFAALLLATPLAISQAHAVGGNGVVTPACGIVEPTSISLGTIIAGSTSTEEKVVVQTSGTIPGTFEMISTDWTGAGAKATGSFLVLGPLAADTITINGQVLTGGSGTVGAGQFDSDGTTTVVAADIVRAINADAQTGSEAYGSGIEVRAFSSVNAVLLTATDVGTGPNAVTVVSNGGADINIVTATLGGGATGAVHMTADKVKVTTQTQSEAAPGTTYAAKTVNLATTNTVLSTATDPDNAEDIDLYFHLDGVSPKATGTVTTLDAMVDGDTITIDGVVFTAEATAADIDGNEFLTVGTAATDAAALDAKIDSTLNLRFVSGTVVGAALAIEAINGGTDGNGITLAQNGDGATVSGGNLAGGVDQLTNLPYSGALTSTLTFGTACDVS